MRLILLLPTLYTCTYTSTIAHSLCYTPLQCHTNGTSGVNGSLTNLSFNGDGPTDVTLVVSQSMKIGQNALQFCSNCTTTAKGTQHIH